MKDTALATYELTHPRDLDEKTATRLFTALSGVYGPVRKLGRMTGRDTIVFEVFATQKRVHYLLSFRPNLAKTVESHLTGVIRNIGIEESTVDVQREWTHVIELGRHSIGGEDKPRPVDPKMVEVLLRSTRGLRANEAVMLQWVMTPIGNIVGDEDGGFWAVGRLAASGHDIPAKGHIGSVLSAYRSLQVFAARRLPKQLNHYVNERRAPVTKWPGTYRPEELAVMCALPIDGPQVPGIVLGRRKLAPDAAIPRKGIVLGEANYPGAQRPIALSPLDLTKHLHIIGQIGTGKSTAIENQIIQAMEQGHGVTFIDPHGDSFRNILDRVPKSRMGDVMLLDLTDSSTPVGLNPFEGDPHMVTNQVIAVFDRLYGMQQMARTMDVLRSTVLTLALKKYTILDIPAVLAATASGERLRGHLVKGLSDPALQDFWRQYEDMPAKMKTEVAYPVITRLRPFETWPSLRGSLGQTKSGFSFEKVFAGSKVVLVNLSKGHLGEEESKLYGSLLVGKFWSAAQRRPQGNRKPYFLYIDEFQNYVNLPVSFATVLDEARKYGICFGMAHHRLDQLPRDLREAVISNARNKLYFAVHASDAAVLARELPPTVPDDFGLSRYEAIARVVIDEVAAGPVTIKTLPPREPTGHAEAVTAASRAMYGRPMEDVEYDLAKRQQAGGAGRQERRKRPIGEVLTSDQSEDEANA
jgi:hypothetical protein